MKHCIWKVGSWLLIFIFGYGIKLEAQTRLKDLNTGRIAQKTIRDFIKSQSDSGIVYFEDFRPSITVQSDSGRYSHNVHRFHLKQSVPISWNSYLTAHPAEIWEGRVVSCAFIYSPVQKKIIFPSDPYPGVEVGQIFFVELRVLLKTVKFPICFMITGVDEVRKTISFSYVASGVAQGAQTIHLSEDDKHGTRIVHFSLHNTRNLIRDKFFYPIYHKKAIAEVHHNIKKQVVRKA